MLSVARIELQKSWNQVILPVVTKVAKFPSLSMVSSHHNASSMDTALDPWRLLPLSDITRLPSNHQATDLNVLFLAGMHLWNAMKAFDHVYFTAIISINSYFNYVRDIMMPNTEQWAKITCFLPFCSPNNTVALACTSVSTNPSGSSY